jgi:hypothetical protein
VSSDAAGKGFSLVDFTDAACSKADHTGFPDSVAITSLLEFRIAFDIEASFS